MIAAFIKDLFKVAPYKPTLGKTARRATMLGMLVLLLAGVYVAYRGNIFGTPSVNGPVCFVLALLSAWFSYRLVQFPPFAEFLVSVEAEMRKVYWPSAKEVKSTSKVVLIFMFLFVALIFVYDTIFNLLITALNKVMGA
ncbi:MAG: preprotein translocase subunit SecE [Thermoguttaceae bacterium]|nr:preprotein translocase subunit SecE [Thermoguttaceae bacterium]